MNKQAVTKLEEFIIGKKYKRNDYDGEYKCVYKDYDIALLKADEHSHLCVHNPPTNWGYFYKVPEIRWINVYKDGSTSGTSFASEGIATAQVAKPQNLLKTVSFEL